MTRDVERNKGIGKVSTSAVPVKSLVDFTPRRSDTTIRQAAQYARKPETLAERALFDIRAFAELIEFKGGWSNFSDCHNELAVFVTKPQQDNTIARLLLDGNEKEAGLRRLTLMPRGHLKSTINTTLYTMWRIYRNPNIRILVGTNNLKLSNSFIRELRSYFENEELQAKVWNNRPHIKGNLVPELQKRKRQRNQNSEELDPTEAEDRKLIWNNVAIQMLRTKRMKEPTIKSTSVGTSEVGSHYDLIILDDVVDFKNVESEIKKQRVFEWLADIESILDPWQVETVGENELVFRDLVGGEMVFNGTRYALDDYYGYLLENQEELEYVVHSRNIYKNGVDDSEGFLWQERFNENVIRRLRNRLSPRRFASQYLNTVYEKDARLFAVDAIHTLADSEVWTEGNKVYVRFDGRVEQVHPIVVIDPAFSSGKKGDDCAIMVGCKLSSGHMIIIDAVVEQLTAAETVMHTKTFCERWNTMRMFHEENGVGMLLPELFKTDEAKVNGKPIVVNSHYEIRTKESKIQGILELPIAAGKLILTQRVKDNQTIWKQLRDYPGVNHDDALDAIVTLWEKTLCKRQKRTADLPFDVYTPRYLLKEWLKTKDNEPKTLLGEYSSYYA